MSMYCCVVAGQAGDGNRGNSTVLLGGAHVLPFHMSYQDFMGAVTDSSDSIMIFLHTFKHD